VNNTVGAQGITILHYRICLFLWLSTTTKVMQEKKR